jgi:hypothetical protein
VILIDTSIWVDFLIDPGRMQEKDFDPVEFVTCGPVVQEVLQGFSDARALPAFRDRLLGVPRLSDPLSLDLFLDAANIYRDGRRKGYTIRSTTDCLIAAIAIHNEVRVWHRDRDFTAIARYTPLRAVTRYLT